MESVSKSHLIKVVRDGKEQGVMITESAWKLFKEKFDVTEKDGGLLISLRNNNDSQSNFLSLYNELIKAKTRFSIKNGLSTDNKSLI